MPATSRARLRVVKRRVLYRGRIIQLVQEIVVVGGNRLVRETIRHPGSVVIVPLLDDRRIVFVRQYRRAVNRRLLELPAGTLDPRERPLACARRELIEETGWRATQMRRIGSFYAAPGFLSERMSIFLATGLRKTQASPEPDEFLQVVTLPLATALAKMQSGAICDAKTIIGLLFVQQLFADRRRVEERVLSDFSTGLR